MKDENGMKKYKHLSALALTILTLSHGNADPERGFSINKRLLDIHSVQIGQHMLVSIRLIKGWIMRKGGLIQLIDLIDLSLVRSVQSSHAKYKQAVEDKRKTEEEKQKQEKNQLEQKTQAEKSKEEQEKIQKGMEMLKSKIKAAESLIEDSQKEFLELGKRKKVPSNLGVQNKKDCQAQLKY